MGTLNVTRCPGQSVVLTVPDGGAGRRIVVTVKAIDRKWVRLGVGADPDVLILRRELLEDGTPPGGRECGVVYAVGTEHPDGVKLWHGPDPGIGRMLDVCGKAGDVIVRVGPDARREVVYRWRDGGWREQAARHG